MLVGRLNSLSAAIVGLILGVLFVLAAAGPAAAQVQPISADAGGVLEFTYDAPIAAVEVRTADFAPVVAPFVATRRSALGPSGQHGNLYDSAADFVAPRALPAFSRSSIDDAVTSVSRAHNDQISVGARAIDKRLGANSAPFQGIEATTSNAQALVTDILENPTRTVFGQRTYDVYNAAGQGARFDVSSNRFITFLDETIATR